MVQLLGNLTTTSRLLYLRVPALNALFPTYRTSVLDALGSIMHDNGLWATGDIYPRYACEYGTPRWPPSSADYPEPFMYTYCRDDHPGVLVRGAKNAPRPAGDDTAGPPPGADLGRTTDPTPKGRFTIPTPYGGPDPADRATTLINRHAVEEMTMTVTTDKKHRPDDRRGRKSSTLRKSDADDSTDDTDRPTPMTDDTDRHRRSGRAGRGDGRAACSSAAVAAIFIAALAGLGSSGLAAVAGAAGDPRRPSRPSRPRSRTRRS